MKTRTRQFFVITIILAITLVLGACGVATSSSPAASGTPAAEASQSAAPEGSASPEAAEPAKDATYTLKLGHSGAIGPGHYHQMAEKFAALVSEKNGGDVVVEIYPNNQIGTDAQAVEACSLGTLDFAMTSAGISSYVKENELVLSYFLFNSYEDVFKYIYSDLYQNDIIKPAQEAGKYQVLGAYPNANQFFISTYEMTDIAGLKGKKFREKDGTAIGQIIDATFGTVTTNVDMSELYNAYATGLIDCQLVSLANYVDHSLTEVAPYVYKEDFRYLVNYLYCSDATLAKLPDEHAQAVREAGREATDWCLEYYQDFIIPEYWGQVEANPNVTIYYPTAEQTAATKKLVEEKIWPYFTETYPVLVPHMEFLAQMRAESAG